MKENTRDVLTTADFAGSTANSANLNSASLRSANLAEEKAREYFDTGNSEIRPNLVPASASEDRTQDAGVVTPLLSDSEIGDLRSRWSSIQAEFVDEPRRSVEQADQLVATAMQRLAEGFANERASLEKQWDSKDAVSTEDLRVALQRYRAFFGRLLNAA